MYEYLFSLHEFADFVSRFFPLKWISLQGSKWGDIWLWRVQRMYSQRDLWSSCDVLFFKVYVLKGLGILEIRATETRLLHYILRIWPPFNIFPKHLQEAQSLIYHSMSLPYRTVRVGVFLCVQVRIRVYVKTNLTLMWGTSNSCLSLCCI